MYVRPFVPYTFNLYNAVYQLYLNKLKKKQKKIVYLKAEISNRLDKTSALCETLDDINSS